MTPYFVKQNSIISFNDGARYFNTESRDCWNKESPIGINTSTNICLTQEGYHCTDFTKSFLHGEVSGIAELDADFLNNYSWDSTATSPGFPEVFFGYTNAIEIFEQY
jgi:hypothetical protein